MSATRRARVRALAKINLDLRVLGKRPDGYPRAAHRLPDDLARRPAGHRIHARAQDRHRAARTIVGDPRQPGGARGAAGRWRRSGPAAGWRCGSRSAFRWARGWAADRRMRRPCCWRLPVLAGRRAAARTLLRIGQQLGSDVPFFLLGGTAVGIGRGTELFPLPDAAARHGAAAGARNPCHHGRGLSRPGPAIDNRISTK